MLIFLTGLCVLDFPSVINLPIPVQEVTPVVHILFLVSYCSSPVHVQFFHAWLFVEYRQKTVEYCALLFLNIDNQVPRHQEIERKTNALQDMYLDAKDLLQQYMFLLQTIWLESCVNLMSIFLISYFCNKHVNKYICNVQIVNL